MTHGGSRRGAGAPRSGNKIHLTVSLGVNPYGFILSEAKKRNLSISATVEVLLEECMGEFTPARQEIQFRLGKDPLDIKVISDPYNLLEVASFVYHKWNKFQGFEISQTKNAGGWDIIMSALPDTWEKAQKVYNVNTRREDNP